MDTEKILKRIEEQKKFDKLTDFAEFLGMNLSNFSRWRKKNNANYTYIIQACRGMDLNYIFYGKSAESKNGKELQQATAELERLREEYDALSKAYLKLTVENEKNLALVNKFLSPQLDKMDEYLRQLHSVRDLSKRINDNSSMLVADEDN